MDAQIIFNVLVGAVGGLGGWILKLFHDELKDHRTSLEGLPDKYARRDDVKEMKTEIVDALKRIEDKVDRKYG